MNIYFLIIFALILLAIAYFAYLKLEKSKKRAMLFIIVLIVSVGLSTLTDEIRNQINDSTNNPTEVTQNDTENTNIVDDGQSLQEKESDDYNENSVIEKIFSFLSPTSHAFAQKINETYFPYSSIRVFILLVELFLIVHFISLFSDKESSNQPLSVLVFEMFFIINYYLVYVFAYAISVILQMIPHLSKTDGKYLSSFLQSILIALLILFEDILADFLFSGPFKKLREFEKKLREIEKKHDEHTKH